MPSSPIGFLSDVWFEDEHENGRRSEICSVAQRGMALSMNDARW